VLQFPDDADIDFADRAWQEAFFGQPDAVLAADRTAQTDGVSKNFFHRFVDPRFLAGSVPKVLKRCRYSLQGERTGCASWPERVSVRLAADNKRN
jgi:hypothetical protein